MVYTTNNSSDSSEDQGLELYFWTADDGKQKVDSEIKYTSRINQSVDTVYYVKDNNVYKCVISGKKNLYQKLVGIPYKCTKRAK